MNKEQRIKSGNNSKNIQIDQFSVANNGLTYTEARDIAQDIFDKNFYKLSSLAADIAKERANEFIELYLKKLRYVNADAINELRNPDLQYMLFTAQKEYVRTGDEDLGEILIQVLVNRSIENNRTLMQIVLNESITAIPKLTKSQLSILTIIFIVRYIKSQEIKDLDSLCNFIRKYLEPFIDDITMEDVYYQHLEFCGCGLIRTGSVKIEDVFLLNYPDIFSENFSEYEHMQKSFEIKKFFIESNPKMNNLFFYWNNSYMKFISLTSVGIAIAHTYLSLHTDFSITLTKWIE